MMDSPLPPSLDRLLALEPGRSAVAARNVAGTLPVFDSHFPRFPVLPGVFLLDSMAATAALMLGEPRGRWWLTAAEVVRFRRFVQPGDEVVIEAALLQRTHDRAACTVTATVDGRAVATARRLHLTSRPAPPPASQRGNEPTARRPEVPA
jgi:3-hydroxyacyl-[acyl-carrier-protein] dehydratase